MISYIFLRSRIARLERRLKELEATPDPVTEKIDKISVRKGSEIAIVPVSDLLYVEACGDYVLLHTPSGRHVKEQTMKFYEASLPDTFVRVHRSYIVNTETIARIEQAGKENYTLRLRDGSSIRISPAGYKLLRERLSL